VATPSPKSKRVIRLPAILLAGCALAQMPAKTVLDGIYTSPQAKHGQTVYERSCASCHRADLSGFSGPPLKTDLFMDRWREFNLNVLADLIENTMPADNPGTLAKSDYLDVLAYILQANDIPAGKKPLTADLLTSTLLVGKEGSKPLPTSAQVASIGCVTLDTGNGWFLTHATEPARTLNPWEITPEELKSAKAQALGDQLFRLQNITDLPGFDRDKINSAKAEAKGVLVRQPKNERINLMSLQSVGENCEP